MLTPDVTSKASSLVATAVAQAFALFAAVFIAADVSGGHVNPAVTFAFALGGHIPFPTAALYWASQLLGSTFACFIVHAISAGQVTKLHYIFRAVALAPCTYWYLTDRDVQNDICRPSRRQG
jgi:glycerol uptake facilitator-like aquaporin